MLLSLFLPTETTIYSRSYLYGYDHIRCRAASGPGSGEHQAACGGHYHDYEPPPMQEPPYY